jgi:hypothetical protein
LFSDSDIILEGINTGREILASPVLYTEIGRKYSKRVWLLLKSIFRRCKACSEAGCYHSVTPMKEGELTAGETCTLILQWMEAAYVVMLPLQLQCSGM